MVDSLTDSFRFGMHLYGWLVLLFLVCFYGQNLIDEVRNKKDFFCISFVFHELEHESLKLNWKNSSFIIYRAVK